MTATICQPGAYGEPSRILAKGRLRCEAIARQASRAMADWFKCQRGQRINAICPMDSMVR